MKNRDLKQIYNYLYAITTARSKLKLFYLRCRMSKESIVFIKERIPSVKHPSYNNVVSYNMRLTETLSRYPNRKDQTLLIERLQVLWNLHNKSQSVNVEYPYKYSVSDENSQRYFCYSGLCLLNNMIGDLTDNTRVTLDVNELFSAKNHDVEIKTRIGCVYWVKVTDPNHKALRLQYLSELIADVEHLLNYDQNDK